jgi:Putative exonuclease SbcCD, C subunit
VLAELERSILDQRSVINERTRELMDTLVMGELARHLQGQIHHLYETIKGINRVLGGLRFGPSEYQFQITPRADRIELVDLVRRLSILDEDSRRQFRAWIDARLDELRAGDDAAVPALLDYRQWFDYKLRMSTTDAAGVELTHRLRQVGSGGEQGVPNYLLVLALGKLMFDAADASVRPMLFDEAFYGIDAGRRDQLLRLATDLGLQLFVASPDQDGVTPAVRAATTLFVVKDANHDVHLAPYHYWNRARDDQPGLFDAPAPGDELAECRTDRHPPAASAPP